ncbi:MAG: hypothetical protein ACPGVU_05480 [Limisphaerales bacterium]
MKEIVALLSQLYLFIGAALLFIALPVGFVSQFGGGIEGTGFFVDALGYLGIGHLAHAIGLVGAGGFLVGLAFAILKTAELLDPSMRRYD